MTNIDSHELDNIIRTEEKYSFIVYFWASWCGPCKQFSPIFDKVNQEQNEGVNLVKMQLDKSDDNLKFAKDYGARSVPTIMGFKDKMLYVCHDKLNESTLRKFIEHVRNG